ncbi:hypothetical protein PS2_013269 [Malus domestica]
MCSRWGLVEIQTTRRQSWHHLPASRMWSSNGEEGLGWMSQRQRRLILGEPELLPARLAILFVADATRAVSLEVEILAVGVSLAPPAATLDTVLLGEDDQLGRRSWVAASIAGQLRKRSGDSDGVMCSPN